MNAQRSVNLTPMSLAPLPSEPLVSVIIANYNYSRFLPGALESVLAQSYSRWELIVCDDGSTDDSRSILAEFELRDSRIKVLCKENGGQGSAWNFAFSRSRGHIIAFLDSDDSFVPEKLEKVVEHFQAHDQAGLLVHPLTVLSPDGEPVQQIPYLSRFEYGWIAPRVIERGGRARDMPASAICVRREVACKIFPLPAAEFRRYADGYVFTVATMLAEISAISESLSLYRLHGENARGSDYVTLSTVQHDIEAAEAQIIATNRVLFAITGQSNVLRLDRNVGLRRNVLLLALLRGDSRRELATMYLGMVPLYWNDDLFGRTRKLLGNWSYAVAVLLPHRIRAWWLSMIFGYGPVKRQVHRLRRLLRR